MPTEFNEYTKPILACFDTQISTYLAVCEPASFSRGPSSACNQSVARAAAGTGWGHLEVAWPVPRVLRQAAHHAVVYIRTCASSRGSSLACDQSNLVAAGARKVIGHTYCYIFDMAYATDYCLSLAHNSSPHHQINALRLLHLPSS
eukprot:2316702-Pleurochrysis_carterae.AAC.1